MYTAFIDFFKKIGFWLGSSRWLAKSLVKYSGIQKPGKYRVLELWGWHGNVTREIIKYKNHIDTLDIMELDDDRMKSLQRFVDSNIRTIHGSATEIDTFLTDWSIDIVISTLPLWSLPLPLVHEILGQIQKVLKTWWVFIQYQYWMVNKKDIKKYFTLEKIAFEPRNFSPACIYVTKK